ncbi:hypothetical protein RFI_18442, partial [Reticulomyxa filosa]
KKKKKEKKKKKKKKGKVTDWQLLMRKIFGKFDEHLAKLNLRGGCTVQLVLYLGNSHKLISANAGDARAVYSVDNGTAKQLSYDHSPMNDWDRVHDIAKKHVTLLEGRFRLADKHETSEDVEKLPSSLQKIPPLITAEQEKSRLLATIGVARGFGDFGLSVFGMKNVHIKPFLSCEPFVSVVDLNEETIGMTDVLVLACDGIFDVLSNEETINKVRSFLWFNCDDTHALSQLTTEEILNHHPITFEALDRACLKLGTLAYARGTVDDVTVFAIPLWFVTHSSLFMPSSYTTSCARCPHCLANRVATYQVSAQHNYGTTQENHPSINIHFHFFLANHTLLKLFYFTLSFFVCLFFRLFFPLFVVFFLRFPFSLIKTNFLNQNDTIVFFYKEVLPIMKIK